MRSRWIADAYVEKLRRDNGKLIGGHEGRRRSHRQPMLDAVRNRFTSL